MAGSPPASVPISAGSPASLAPASETPGRPSLCIKPTVSTSQIGSHAGSPAGSLTSREWVVPPRPKPGRKPATDTPPTKRKAQNRAAQRAFRERRAARVGELEEQLKQVEQDNDQEQDTLKAEVTRLEKEVEHYRDELTRWIERCRALEEELGDTKLRTPGNRIANPHHESRPSTALTDAATGCGNCTADSACQCLDEVVNALANATEAEALSAPPDTSAPSPDRRTAKRVKIEPSDDMEIDFTAVFSKTKTIPAGEDAVSPSSAVADPCGFCSDGTPCICAEMAAEQAQHTTVTLPSSRQLAQFTPPPSEGDVVNPTAGSGSSCALGPGTCSQCQSDPNSTLFCKSLAASRAQAGLDRGCCGGRGRDGGCCQSSTPLPSRASRTKLGKPQLPPVPASKPITLSCADAYTTLSRHPAYNRASSDIATWMPKLHASPIDMEGRPALEIDAANVMSVLRDFDRRFGSER